MPPKKDPKVVDTSGWDPKPWVRPGLGTEQVMEIKDAFDLFDVDRSGEISIVEMLEAMRSLGYDVERGEAAGHVKNLDTDGSGALEFNEFYDLMTASFNQNTPKADIERIFKMFDEDNTKWVSVANLRAICDMIGDVKTDEELADILLKNDVNNNGNLDFEDFYNVMTKNFDSEQTTEKKIVPVKTYAKKNKPAVVFDPKDPEMCHEFRFLDRKPPANILVKFWHRNHWYEPGVTHFDELTSVELLQDGTVILINDYPGTNDEEDDGDGTDDDEVFYGGQNNYMGTWKEEDKKNLIKNKDGSVRGDYNGKILCNFNAFLYQQCYRIDKEKAHDTKFKGSLTLSVSGKTAKVDKSSMKLNFNKLDNVCGNEKREF